MQAEKQQLAEGRDQLPIGHQHVHVCMRTRTAHSRVPAPLVWRAKHRARCPCQCCVASVGRAGSHRERKWVATGRQSQGRGSTWFRRSCGGGFVRNEAQDDAVKLPDRGEGLRGCPGAAVLSPCGGAVAAGLRWSCGAALPVSGREYRWRRSSGGRERNRLIASPTRARQSLPPPPGPPPRAPCQSLRRLPRHCSVRARSCPKRTE